MTMFVFARIWSPDKRKILNAMGVSSAMSIAFGIFLLFLLFRMFLAISIAFLEVHLSVD